MSESVVTKSRPHQCVANRHLGHSDGATPACVVGLADLDVVEVADLIEGSDAFRVLAKQGREVFAVAAPDEGPEPFLEVPSVGRYLFDPGGLVESVMQQLHRQVRFLSHLHGVSGDSSYKLGKNPSLFPIRILCLASGYLVPGLERLRLQIGFLLLQSGH